MVEWAIANIRAGRWAEPWVVSFEYGGVNVPPVYTSEPAVLLDQVPRLYALAKSL
jgi:hypothetical protein